MSKRLSIPETNSEAERFLWHALFYLGVYSGDAIEQARKLLVDAIAKVQ